MCNLPEQSRTATVVPLKGLSGHGTTGHVPRSSTTNLGVLPRVSSNSPTSNGSFESVEDFRGLFRQEDIFAYHVTSRALTNE